MTGVGRAESADVWVWTVSFIKREGKGEGVPALRGNLGEGPGVPLREGAGSGREGLRGRRDWGRRA